MSAPTVTQCHSSDQVLEQLLDEITIRIQAGEVVEAEEYRVEYPDYIDRLQRLLPAMQSLAAFGRSQAMTSDGATGRSQTQPPGGVLGDFRILRELGRGGMGIVYEAEQISIGRPVALKVLPFASMLDERRLARFRNEVRAAGQLHHTNIVPIFAVGSDRGVHFYAMQLVSGQTLADVITDLRRARRLDDIGPVPPESAGVVSANGDTARAALSTVRAKDSAAFYRTVAQLGIQAADALEHAHHCGIVHRDIKPSNLMIDERGVLWLADFGLASVECDANLTMTGDLLGTLRYMSPEQTRGSRAVLDHRTDIYSLGATLYELLTQRPPFEAADRNELLRQINDTEPQTPHRVEPAIPADLETIVLKAMSKDAADRYSTAQHMADDLRRFLENKPIEARRPTLLERGRKWTIRHTSLVAIAAGSLAVVAMVGSAATLFTLRAYRAENRQRAAAENNLAVASQIIDRLLSHEADDKYYQGDLQHAEKLAADASSFYEELLKHSDDPDLRFRAANAESSIAHIWEIIGRHEKAGLANRRAGELLQKLTTQFPGEPRYLASLASNFNQIGLVDWALDRPVAAEPAWRQAWGIWTELAERFPHKPAYQDGVARMLANLGCVCYFTDRFDAAEEYYRRAEAIKEHLPDEMKNSAAGLASHAGSLTNQAEMARLRGQYDRALELLEESIPYHQQTLEKWPTNPVALDCYFYMYRNMVDCHLDAVHPADAAATIERMVATFPDRLEAYHVGAEKLLSCAALADWEGKAPAEPLATPPNGSAGASPSQAYRRRAHELIAKASGAPQHTPDTVNAFAWFLLMSDDKSFRDAPLALKFAKDAVSEVPERGDAWFTLALAHYRTGNWRAADDAEQKSIKFSHGEKADQANAYDWLLLSMIRFQQGRTDDASDSLKKGNVWIAENKPKDQELISLAAEAEALLEPINKSSAVSKPVTNSH